MFRYSILTLLCCSFSCLIAWSQTNFIENNNYCINQSLNINISEIYDNYELFKWDFCLNEFNSNPVVNDLFQGEYIDNVRGMSSIFYNGVYYIFFTDQKSGSLYRCKLSEEGNDVLSIVELSYSGDALVLPEEIELIKANDNWFAFIGSNLIGHGITRIDFGEDLLNENPTSVLLGNFGLNSRFRDLYATIQNNELILILLALNNNSLIRINYKDSFNNSPNPYDIITHTLTNSSFPNGLEFIKSETNWIAYVLSPSVNKIIRYDLGPDILSSPVLKDEYIFPGFNRPFRMVIAQEGNNYYGIVTNEYTTMTLLDLGQLTEADLVEELSYDLPLNFDIVSIYSLGKHFIYGFDLNRLNQISFDEQCFSSISYSEEKIPNVFYSESGVHHVALKAENTFGEQLIHLDTVSVTTKIGPQLEMDIPNICLLAPLNFFGNVINGEINTWSWDFGDGLGASTLQNPTYQYQDPRDYLVSLNVEAENGCSNSVSKTISIYDPPSADFVYPGTLQCSNNEISFTNQTNFSGPDSLLSYQWNMNDEVLLSEQDPAYTFASGGDKNIMLTATIPGCSSEISKIINITPGPLASFTFDGTCAYDEFSFINNTTGDNISGYQWDFGDGYFSSVISPHHQFESGGTYVVGLTASNDLGCSTKLEQIIPVRFIPELNFTNDLACSDNSVTLFDQSTVTDANITDRNWALKNTVLKYEQTSTGSAPSFTLDAEGVYEVALVAESNYGCLDTLVRTMNVNESPVADFTFENTCFGDSTYMIQDVSLPGGATIASIDWLIDGILYSSENIKYKFANPGDHDIELYVRASNLCPDNISKTLTINPLPEIDFTLSSNCEDQLVTTSPVIISPVDPVISYNWLINNKPVSLQEQFQYEFTKAEDYIITLNVSTENDCFNSTFKNITIHPSPVSRFDVIPSIGASPLQVQFTDRSQGAMDLSYKFSLYNQDGSSDPNPVYVYDQIGHDLATQIVENEFGCADTSTQSIEVVIPIYDINVTRADVHVIDDQLNLLVELKNNGTIPINRPKLRIDIGEKISLNQDVETVIMPGDDYEYAFDFNILLSANEPLDYLCVSIADQMGAYQDENPDDNAQCINIDQLFNVLDPFPNPSRSYVDVPIILPVSGTCDLQMIGEKGEIVYSREFTNLRSGLNTINIDLSPYRKGFYLLVVQASDFEATKKIVIQ